MKKSKRYVVFFIDLTKVIGSKHQKQLTIRTAAGPIEAYRKATGWTGRVVAGKGYSEQMPARQIQAYYERGDGEEAFAEWVHLNNYKPAPPTAYVVPLGKW